MISPLASFAIWQGQQDHVFVYDSGSPINSVAVAGTFNNWDMKANLMVGSADKKHWSVNLKIVPGKHYYKFVIDGNQWINDPKNARLEDDGNGNVNNVVIIQPKGYDKPAKIGDGIITESAIQHLQEIPFLNWDRGRLRLTVSARTQDVSKILVRFIRPNGSVGQSDLKLSSGDELTSRYSAIIDWDRKSKIKYWFALNDGQKSTLFLGPNGLSKTKNAFVLSPATFTPFQPPRWVESSVVYQIFPDRFCNGNLMNDPADVVAWDGAPTYSNFFGGDFAGVQTQIPYLKDLGIGCIYFNPVFSGPSNHRYEASDYKKIDWRLGSNHEFDRLTKELKANNIRTILDGVFNHTAVDFFAFDDILKNQQASQYLSWYSIHKFPVEVKESPNYEAWFGFPSMPKLNNSNTEVRKYLLSVPEFWSKNSAISGWRLDVANEVPHDYWKLFRKKVKSLNPENWIVGEIWGDGSPWLKGDEFDSVMNYQFREAVLGFVARRKIKPTDVWSRLIQVYDSYGPQVSRNMMNLLSSHDTPRILNECQGDIRLARLAAMFQFSWVGSPSIYYGDELGMDGGRDPDNRRGMKWNLATSTNKTLLLYRALCQLRAKSLALQSGDPELVLADNDKDILAFHRKLGSNDALIIFNRSESSEEFPSHLINTPRTSKILTFYNSAQDLDWKIENLPPKNQSNSVKIPPLSMVIITDHQTVSSLAAIRQKDVDSNTHDSSLSMRIKQ